MPRLLHLSDTHLAAPGAPSAHPELDAAARLREVIAAVMCQGPFDAVVLTGDICDDGSAQGAAAVHEIVSHCAPIVLGVPGNHDLSARVREAFGRAQAWLEDWRILGVETQVEGEVAGVAEDAVAEIDELDDFPTVVLMHHPLLSRSTHPWFTLGNAEALAGVVQRHAGPLVLLSGHTHEAFDARLGEAYLYGAPSTYYGIVHEGDTWSYAPDVIGARIVELAADGRVSSTLVTPDRL